MFILFFGTRPGTPSSHFLQGVSCPYCTRKNTLTAKVTSHYFHLFWLPLFRVATFRVAECAHCKRTYDQDDFTEAMIKALE